MLRRVTRAFRLGLGVAGACIVLWLPVSYLAFASLKVPLPSNQYVFVHTTWGRFRFVAVETGSTFGEPPSLISYGVTDGEAERQRPMIAHGSSVGPAGAGKIFWVHIPIYCVAFLCLAWPVTSFVIARRRRGLRGFEVQAVGGNAVSTVDS